MTETQTSASRGDVAGTGGAPLQGRALRLVMLVLAFACGASVANLYYAQPLLGLIRQTFGVSAGTSALVVTLTQIGYAVGLALLLPLGDLLENRRLSSRTLVVTAAALAVAAAAPGFGLFLVAMALVGVTSVVAQVLIPLAAHLAPPQSRGRYVGQVTGGLLLGIMLARSVASLAAAAWGWRSIYAISAGVMLATALALARLLPRRQPAHSASYGRLVASSAALARAEPLLLRRALSQALMFGAFTAYWTAIAFELTGQHHLTQAGIAVFALVGAAGAVAAPVAGRLGDRGLGASVRGTAVALGVAALLLAATAASHLVLLALSAVLLDFAVQGGHVLNMRDIYALRPDARARMNSVYMTTIFAGGAAASAVAGPVSQHWGWPGVAVFAAILVAGAGLVWTGEQLFWRQRPVQALGESLGRHVGEGDLAAEGGAEGRGHLRVGDGGRAGQGVRGTFGSGLSKRGRGHVGDVPHVHRADRRVADRGEEPALGGDRLGQGEQALEEQVGPQERVADAQVADVPLDRGVIAQEPHRRILGRG